MSFLLRHWQIAVTLVAVLSIGAFIHERDQRIRAQGRVEVLDGIADSLQQVADSMAVVAADVDARAEDSILQLETVIASIQESEPRREASTDSTIDLLRSQAPEDMTSLIDSLEVEIMQERIEHAREVNALYAALDVKDEQLRARDQQIMSLEAALAARIRVSNEFENTQTGFLEKAGWALGGAVAGYVAGKVF